MANISCPKCGKAIDLNSNFCSNCGFDIQNFYGNADSLYNYGLQYLHRNPSNSYYAFYRASELGHAPSMYQLGILFFENDDLFKNLSMPSRKRNCEHCLVTAAKKGYDLALKKIVQMKPILSTQEAIDYVSELEEAERKAKEEKIAKSIKKTVVKEPELSEEELEKQRVLEEAFSELKELEKAFNLIKQPYYLSFIQVSRIYQRCSIYDQTIIDKVSFFTRLKSAYEQATNDKKIIDSFNDKIRSSNLYGLPFAKISELYNKYNSLPEYLKKDVVNRHRLLDAYDRAYQDRIFEEKITSINVLKKEEKISKIRNLMDDFYSSIDTNTTKGSGKVTPAMMLSDPDYEEEKKFFDLILSDAYDFYNKKSSKLDDISNRLDASGLTASELEDFFRDREYYEKQANEASCELKFAAESYNQPYFGRLKTKNDDYYIGKHEIKGKVIDWRSSKASLYYQYKFNLDFIKLVREFDIRCSRLIDFQTKYKSGDIHNVDSVVTDDEYLNRALEFSRQNKATHDIIKTIQKEQYEMMTAPLKDNIIINGSAGSGKTMVLLHRLSYILFNEKIDPKTIHIISPTRFLDSELDFLSQSLDLNLVDKTSYQAFLLNAIYKYFDNYSIRFEKEYFNNIQTINKNDLTNYSLAYNFCEHVDRCLEKGNKEYSSFVKFYSELLIDKYSHFGNEKNADYLLNKDSKYFKVYCILAYLIKECSYINYQSIFNDIKRVKSADLQKDDEDMLKQLLSINIKEEFYDDKTYKKITKEYDFLESFENHTDAEKIKILFESFGIKTRKKSNPISKKILSLFRNMGLLFDVPYSFVTEYSMLIEDVSNFEMFKKGKNSDVLLFEIFKYNLKQFKLSRYLNVKNTFDFELVYMVLALSRRYGTIFRDGMILLDEYQNYRFFEIQLLKNLFEKSVFNLFGDVNQTTNPDGVGFSDKFNDYLIGENYINFETNINYRNAFEITNYINKKLSFNMVPVGVSGNVEEMSMNNFYIHDYLTDDRVALVVKNIGEFKEYLKKYFVSNRERFNIIDDDSVIERNVVNVIDVNFVKGLEFDIVYVFDKNMTKNEKYVAYTRALKELFVIK